MISPWLVRQCYAEVWQMFGWSDDGPAWMLAVAAEPASTPTFLLSLLSFLEVNPKLVRKEFCFLFAVFSPEWANIEAEKKIHCFADRWNVESANFCNSATQWKAALPKNTM